MLLKFRTHVKDWVNRTFHDEITGIEEPREWRIKYRDIGERLEGYIVPVTYKCRGKRDMYFCIDCDHLQLISQQRALRNANEFYSRVRKQLFDAKLLSSNRGGIHMWE